MSLTSLWMTEHCIDTLGLQPPAHRWALEKSLSATSTLYATATLQCCRDNKACMQTYISYHIGTITNFRGRLLIDGMHSSWGRFRSGPCAIYTPEIQLTISSCRCSYISYPLPNWQQAVNTMLLFMIFVSWYTIVSWKMVHGRSTLQVCQRGGWALFWLFPHLTMKECPCHVCNDLKPSKQIIRHKITYNGITSGFEVESWRHTALWTEQCDGEYTIARG